MATYTNNLNLEKPAGADYVDVSVINDNMDIIDEAVTGKEAKASITQMTLLATGWHDGEYSFEGTYPVASNDIEIELNSTATQAQIDAYNNAQILGNATANKVKATGSVPTIDIPIIIKVVVK